MNELLVFLEKSGSAECGGQELNPWPPFLRDTENYTEFNRPRLLKVP